jgi:hypothetical protein
VSANGLLIAAVLGQLITFAGVVTGLVFAYLREGRVRDWLVKDREQLEKVTLATAEAQTTHTTAAANGLHASLVVIQQDLAETKKAAGDAYNEANHVNLKLQQIGLDRMHIDEASVSAAIKLAVRKELTRLRGKLLARGTGKLTR